MNLLKNWTNLIEKARKLDVKSLEAIRYAIIGFILLDLFGIYWYLELKKNEYQKWCKENIEDDWQKVFNKRKIYSTFINELFVTSEMVEKMLNGNNIKKIKKRFK